MYAARIEPGSDRTWPALIVVAALVATLHLLIRLGFDQPRAAPDIAVLAGLAYAPFGDGLDPTRGDRVDVARLRSDLALLRGWTTRLRTYTVSAGLEALPAVAVEHGIDVLPCAWLGPDRKANATEVAELLAQAEAHRHWQRVLVGNEAIHRGDLAVAEVAALLRAVRKATDRAVSTSETWDVWLAHPQLADAADFLAVHILPYWEGVPADQALARTQLRLAELQARYPDKPIVVTEVGWPSGGGRVKSARPSGAAQALFLRQFAAYADNAGIDYYWMEAIDQPWKAAQEDAVGAYWGLFDEGREPKLKLTGPVHADPWLKPKTIVAVLLALALTALISPLLTRTRWPGLLLVVATVNGSAALYTEALAVPLLYYLASWEWIALLLFLPAMLLLVGSSLVVSLELGEVLWPNARFVRHTPCTRVPDPLPWVTVQVPCANEPAAMVLETLDALARLDYPQFDVQVLINNTADRALYEWLNERAQTLGPRFSVHDLGQLDGYKGAALAVGRPRLPPQCEYVAVLDADYCVDPDWLRAVLGHFDDPRVGFVQAPQAHRLIHGGAFERAVDAEFEAFFRLGMHHRQQRDALIQHGTMAVIRVVALDAVGGWSATSIVEDAELGLRLHAGGWRGIYLDHICGRGLTPADLAALKAQRRRWAFGAVQILRSHWRDLLGRSALSLGQRFHYLTGWLGWFADALQLPFALFAVLFTAAALLLPGTVDLPLPVLIAPVLTAMGLRLALSLYALRRALGSTRRALAAALVAMGLAHAVARGIWHGLERSRWHFATTRKRGSAAVARRGGAMPIREEGGIALALLIAAGGVLSRPELAGSVEGLWWLAFLLAMSLPAVATLVVYLLDRLGTTQTQR